MHPVLLRPTENNRESIVPLHEAGHTSLKFFMSYGNFDRKLPDFLEAMKIVRDAGGIALIHCEDAAIMACAGAALLSAGASVAAAMTVTSAGNMSMAARISGASSQT